MSPVSDISVSYAVRARQTKAIDLAAAESPFTFERGLAFDVGAGLNQVDRLWHDRRGPIAAAGNDDIDLNGVLFDVYGDAVNLLRVKGLFISSDAANPGDLVVGNHATAAWASLFGAATHTLKLVPGGQLYLLAPTATAYPVTAATADILRVNNAGASAANYDIAILGSAT